ncbi:Exosome non-catalytic core component [Naganishia albida]|nr:Exosome non-catalytic core component [Naganishia albida]
MSSSRIEILNEGGLRQDGRRPYELRSTAITFTPHPTADGCATMQQGLTTVTATVFGPREPKAQTRPVHDRAVVNVEVGEAGWASQGGKRTRGDKRLTEVAAAVRDTFEPVILLNLYPRTEISIYLQVLGSDGGILSTAINATTLALIDAGIAMQDYTTSLTVGLHLTQPLLDLSGPEEQSLPHLTIAALPGTGKVSLATLETRVHVDRFEEMLRVGGEACRVLHEEMRGEVRRRTGRVVERMQMGQGGGQGS